MNHVRSFCKSCCLTCCVMSLLVRFSRVAFENFENIFLIFVVRLYVGMFEVVNRLEVLSFLI